MADVAPISDERAGYRDFLRGFPLFADLSEEIPGTVIGEMALLEETPRQGSIEVASRPGRTVFGVRLPVDFTVKSAADQR